MAGRASTRRCTRRTSTSTTGAPGPLPAGHLGAAETRGPVPTCSLRLDEAPETAAWSPSPPVTSEGLPGDGL